ncbi:MAG: hypothetical protein ABMA00_01570 [Gemmatimonas sp.]
MAVHARPAAFDGVDGFSYSVDILSTETGDSAAPWGAYLFFVKWAAGEPQVAGHLETDFLATGSNEALVKRQVGAMPLPSVKATLDGLIRTSASRSTRASDRPWWEAAADEGDDGAVPGRTT